MVSGLGKAAHRTTAGMASYRRDSSEIARRLSGAPAAHGEVWLSSKTRVIWRVFIFATGKYTQLRTSALGTDFDPYDICAAAHPGDSERWSVPSRRQSEYRYSREYSSVQGPCLFTI